MATPIAYKGAAAGAKVQALTLLDFLLRPELVQQAAHDYYENVQTKRPAVRRRSCAPRTSRPSG